MFEIHLEYRSFIAMKSRMFICSIVAMGLLSYAIGRNTSSARELSAAEASHYYGANTCFQCIIQDTFGCSGTGCTAIKDNKTNVSSGDSKDGSATCNYKNSSGVYVDCGGLAVCNKCS
jgi:hypothetical protein